MEIDRSRFLALVSTLGAATTVVTLAGSGCASGNPAPKPIPPATSSAPVATASALPSASAVTPREPPAVAGPRLRPGPCVEGGVEWPQKIACDDRAWEVDCERLAPPNVCSWATATKKQCLRVAKYAKPAFATMWIEGMLCSAHADRRYVCQIDKQRMQPSWMVNGEECRRDDAADVCARMVKACAGAKAGDASLIDWCRNEIGTLNDAGVKWVEACIARRPACAGRNEMRGCFEGVYSIDEE
jgi:hypothetical protein